MLSEEEKEAIHYFSGETTNEAMYYGSILVNLIEKQTAEIKKKDKIIDLMATECSIQTGRYENMKKEDIIDYFTNKAKED